MFALAPFDTKHIKIIDIKLIEKMVGPYFDEFMKKLARDSRNLYGYNSIKQVLIKNLSEKPNERWFEEKPAEDCMRVIAELLSQEGHDSCINEAIRSRKSSLRDSRDSATLGIWLLASTMAIVVAGMVGVIGLAIYVSPLVLISMFALSVTMLALGLGLKGSIDWYNDVSDRLVNKKDTAIEQFESLRADSKVILSAMEKDGTLSNIAGHTDSFTPQDTFAPGYPDNSKQRSNIGVSFARHRNGVFHHETSSSNPDSPAVPSPAQASQPYDDALQCSSHM